MDEKMKCKNCRYIIEDRENHTFCCTNEKWNNNFDARFQETEPDDFCSKFEEKIEKLSEIEVEILKLAKKLNCDSVVKVIDSLYFSARKGNELNEILRLFYCEHIFRNFEENIIYLIDKLLRDNE